MTKGDSRTVDAYDVYHEVYDAETVDFWERFPTSVVKKFVNSLPGGNVLNLGSGPGRDALLLRKAGLTVTCLDGSINMVEATRKLGFHSIHEDMRNMSFPDASFDGVWAYSSLFHVNTKEMKGVLDIIHRILKKDGQMLLGLIEGDGDEEISIGGSKYSRYFQYYSEASLDHILKNEGFALTYSEKYIPGHQVYLNNIYRKIS